VFLPFHFLLLGFSHFLKGDLLHVLAPPAEGDNGQLRVVEARVPDGLLPGMTFFVRAPRAGAVPNAAAPAANDLELTSTEEAPSPPMAEARYCEAKIGASTSATAVAIAPPRETDDWKQQNNASISLPTANALPGGIGEQQQQQQQENADGGGEDDDSLLVLVRVPPNCAPGTAIRVQIEDGRLIDATVPDEEGVAEFYVRVPNCVDTNNTSNSNNNSDRNARRQRQHWHDNPLATAPMMCPFIIW